MIIHTQLWVTPEEKALVDYTRSVKYKSVGADDLSNAVAAAIFNPGDPDLFSSGLKKASEPRAGRGGMI